MQYLALVHKDEGSAYGVTFPDVPGCFSAADEYADIIPNAIEALELHLDGEEAPTPRNIEVLRREVADDLAEGAFLISVPFIQSGSKLVRANISLDKATLAAIDEAARQRGLTRSAFIAEATRKEIFAP